MTEHRHRLKHKTFVTLVRVVLPNAKRMMESLQDSMNLNPKINLYKVLCISNFFCNLIPMAQLIREFKCIVIFDDGLCVIQSHISKSLIRVGRLRGRVNHFNNVSTSTTQVNIAGSHNSWHGCLGHPSDPVLSLLSKDFEISGISKNNVMDLMIFVFVPNIHTESNAKQLFELTVTFEVPIGYLRFVLLNIF